MSKVIDEVVFKKSIEDMLQYLSDHCLYEFVPYSDESIAELFSLTPEEAQKLSDLISDEVVSKYKLWSSSKVNDELIAAKTECNDYTDKMLTNISSISIKYVDTLPTSDISTSTIYILKNTGGGNDTLNLYDGGSWTSIGEFTISLEDFYKKDVVDTKLNDKANKTEVLSQDDVIVNKALATNSNVLTAKAVVDELDLKANDSEVVKKTDIATTIDSTSTNDTVPTNKAVYDKILDSEKVIVKNFTDTNGGDFIECLNSFGLDLDKIYSLGFSNLYTNLPHTNGWWEVLITGSFSEKICIAKNTWGNEYYTSNLIYYNDAWAISGSWKRICTTSVANTSGTATVSDGATGTVSYKVINGVCYVAVQDLANSLNGNQVCNITGLPKPSMYVNEPIECLGNRVGTIFCDYGNTTFMVHKTSTIGGYGSFSYPVEE